MKPRTRARCIALQALFEIDMVGHPIDLVLSSHLEETQLDKPLAEFVQVIVHGVWGMVDILDRFITVHAPEWPLDQVSIIDRNIIRIALWEFAVYRETPLKVAINEAVELAKLYGSDSAPRFVNGVLGSLSGRQNEIQQSIVKYLEV
jgi:N utilization substance protein B